MVKLKTALDENKNYVNICDVNKREKKKYFCPDVECSAELIPKKGSIKAHHFAHKAGTPSCYGIESILHLLTKEVLAESRILNLPPAYMYSFEIYNEIKSQINEIENEVGFSLNRNFYESHFFWELSDSNTLVLFENTYLKLKNYTIEIERYLGKIKPDLILIHKKTQRKLHIEITVTHKIDDNKKRIIKENDYAFLDINLSYDYLKNFDYSKSDIKKLLKKTHFQWVNIPKRKKLISKKKDILINNFRDSLIKSMNYYFGIVEPLMKERIAIIISDFDIYKELRYEIKLIESSIPQVDYTREIHNYFFKKFKSSNFYQDHLDKANKKKLDREKWRKEFFGEDFYNKVYRPHNENIFDKN